MKICLVDEIANCGFHLAKGLGERGHDVLVLLDRKRFESVFRFTQEVPKNVRVKWLSPLPIRPRAFGLAYPLMKEIIKFKPDIIHVNYLWSQLFISQIAAWRLKVPVVGVGHGWEVLIVPHSKIRGIIQRIFFKKIDRIILTADYYLKELDNISDHKKVFVGRVIDTDYFNPNIDASEISSKYGENIVTFTARLYKIKTPYTVLRAFRLVLDQIPSVNFLIIGKGPERKGMERLVKKLSMSENVHFLGQIPNPEVRKYLNASKVEVRGFQPNIVELGISQLEALASGTPIVTYYPKGDVPGVIHATDPESISQSIIKVINNPDFRRELSQKGRDFVVKEASVQIGARNTLKVYAEIFKERGNLKEQNL
ncbi:MAG: glycosyltransferase family 4 protein [Candidatus Hodarchaeales archaeon]|jgi:glycosyltransferase involved in cell wall biosynthesis